MKAPYEKKDKKSWKKGLFFRNFLDPFGRFFSSGFYKKKVFEHFLTDILAVLSQYSEQNIKN